MSERDFLSTLLPARFRGVDFWVERDSKAGGRRIEVHEFPMRDRPYNEDLGEQHRRFRVRAYVFGDDVEAQADRLFEACTRRGAGGLQLPVQPALQAVCLNVSRDFDATQLGYIAFDLEFVQDNGVRGGAFSTPLVSRLTEVAGDKATAAVNAAIAAIDWQGAPGAARDAAADTLAVAVATVAAATDSLAWESDPSGALRALDRLASSPAAHVATMPDGDMTRLVGEAFSGLRETAADPAQFAETMAAVVEAVPAPQPAPTAARADRWAEILSRGVSALVRAHGAVAAASAAAGGGYDTRRQAVRVRARLSRAFDLVRDVVDEEAALAALAESHGKAAEALHHLMTDLRPVVTVTAPASLPAVMWSWQLYGDVAATEDLVGRNAVPHPAFMPEAFEALASDG